jgi:ribokinase
MSPDLAVLGNLLLDDIVYTDGSTQMAQPGGAALYVALGASLWGVNVGIVSRIGDDYPQPLLRALADRGIALDGLRPTTGPTLRTWLLYEGRRRRVIHRLGGPTHEDVSPTAEDLPAAWKPQAIHLAPMPWKSQKSLIESLASTHDLQISADPYELLTDQNLESWRDLFAQIDCLFLSEDEMTIPGGLDSPIPVLEKLAPKGPVQSVSRSSRLGWVAYKRGELGGLLYSTTDGGVHEWTARQGPVVDPTGAGDAFAGGVLAGKLIGDNLPRAIARGLISASFALEGQGSQGLFGAEPQEARARLSRT